jgi:hypothetical protein
MIPSIIIVLFPFPLLPTCFLEINTPFMYGLDKPEFMGRIVNVPRMLVSYMVMLFATICA